MAHMIMVTPIDTGVWIIVGTGGIKKIEDSTETPKPVVETKVTGSGSTEPLLTPPLGSPPPAAIVKSTITFMDGKTLIVKESMGELGKLTGAEHA